MNLDEEYNELFGDLNKFADERDRQEEIYKWKVKNGRRPRPAVSSMIVDEAFKIIGDAANAQMIRYDLDFWQVAEKAGCNTKDVIDVAQFRCYDFEILVRIMSVLHIKFEIKQV